MGRENINVVIDVKNNQITFIGNGNLSMNIAAFVTYGEIKNALPSTGNIKIPGINQLRKTAKMIVHKETDSGIIEIYDNGFFTFEECGHVTVYGVDRCERPSTYNSSEKYINLDIYPWDIILEAAGAARLSHNFESREEYQAEISIDAPESINNLSLSVRPEYEVREEEEEQAEQHQIKMKKMKKYLDKLTEKQKMILRMAYGEGLTQEQIAKKMGISRWTVREQLSSIKRKFDL